MRSLSGELLLLMDHNFRRARYSSIAASALMALLIMQDVAWPWPLLWMSAVILASWMHARLLSRLPLDTTRSEQRRLRHATWSFVRQGVAWTSLFAFFPFVPTIVGAVITIFICGVASTALNATSGYRPAFASFVIIAMTPVAICWGLFSGDEATVLQRTIFAIVTVVFIITMLGYARGAFAVFQDSYRIRLERFDLLAQLQSALGRAESANQAKTRFLAAASHDLRQPIHALSLFSSTLAMRPLDAQTSVVAAYIDNSVKALASQLDALLDISRLDAGVIKVSRLVIDLEQMLAQLREEFDPLAEKKGLGLRVDCSQRPLLRTDPMLLQRILRNLLSNGIKYTEAGQVEVSARTLGRNCRIVVSDSGPGIPVEEQQHVFEEFYQLQNPERDRSKGLGLGLAIVQRMTGLLGIDLHLDSAPGQGCRFTLDVPSASADELTAVAAVAIQTDIPGGTRVLVIDDEEVIRAGMNALLTEMGFEVWTASSMQGALEAAGALRPSVVLADFRLRGDDDGMRAIRALRERWPGLPALLISGDTAPDRLRDAQSGGIELLHKPLGANVLRDSILRAIER